MSPSRRKKIKKRAIFSRPKIAPKPRVFNIVHLNTTNSQCLKVLNTLYSPRNISGYNLTVKSNIKTSSSRRLWKGATHRHASNMIAKHWAECMFCLSAPAAHGQQHGYSLMKHARPWSPLVKWFNAQWCSTTVHLRLSTKFMYCVPNICQKGSCVWRKPSLGLEEHHD